MFDGQIPRLSDCTPTRLTIFLTCDNGCITNTSARYRPQRNRLKGTVEPPKVGDRAHSRLTGYRRLAPRYEHHPRNYLAFLDLAATLCRYKRLLKLTM